MANERCRRLVGCEIQPDYDGVTPTSGFLPCVKCGHQIKVNTQYVGDGIRDGITSHYPLRREDD